MESHKGREWINIDLPAFTDPGFVINDDGARLAAKAGFIETLQDDDTLFLDIAVADYRKAITHEVPTGFMDRTFGFDRINVLGLRTPRHFYFTQDQLVQRALANLEDKRLTLVLMASFLALVGLGFLAGWHRYVQAYLAKQGNQSAQ